MYPEVEQVVLRGYERFVIMASCAWLVVLNEVNLCTLAHMKGRLYQMKSRFKYTYPVGVLDLDLGI